MSESIKIIRPVGVCPLCAHEANLLAGLNGGCLYSCSECGFTPEGLQIDIHEAVKVWDRYSAPSFDGAKINIVGWGWFSPALAKYVIATEIEEAREAIGSGYRVIPVYGAVEV